jgi:hypothetical protein
MENVLRMRLRVRWWARLIDLLLYKQTKECKSHLARFLERGRHLRHFLAARGAPNVEERLAEGKMRGAHHFLLAFSGNYTCVHV